MGGMMCPLPDSLLVLLSCSCVVFSFPDLKCFKHLGQSFINVQILPEINQPKSLLHNQWLSLCRCIRGPGNLHCMQIPAKYGKNLVKTIDSNVLRQVACQKSFGLRYPVCTKVYRYGCGSLPSVYYTIQYSTKSNRHTYWLPIILP